MILSFKHKGLELFFTTGSIAGIQAKHATKLRLQLDALNRATCPQDMNAPSWRLHPLKGNLKEHWSITVNGNWRITFKFENGHAEIVDYQDYH
ncbi:Killer protein [Haemophilus parahaemolyticus]|uniref:type II toxin-antitoxin system RelE/ParE family toxin n=1 Tax=Haemophilus parahaemolyticus TaxID=735 RepID=UPI000DADC97E|nr:type II toxin-antitoxin system RelE/ParE family toxin [Haemophilus parahaemolyticus]RDE83031.1 Killer protein [Haemophilus parahaemolyticus]